MSSLRQYLGIALLIGLGALSPAHAPAQLPFFSGAEGYGGSFGGSAPAGGWFSNATIYHVTNLNDSGPGSLRNAFVENSSNKIIVFDVAGTIQLSASTLDIKNLSNYYIAGQTAPGPVTIYGNTTQITHSSSTNNTNVILRYLTFRKGATGNGEDAITFAGGSGPSNPGVGRNMILDHVSASWAEDEILSVANNNTNVTVQYSMINDALVSNHAYGSLIRPRIDSNVTFHHNLYAHNASRQARFGTYNGETLTTDFRNNVIYNWRDRASYAGGSSEPEQEAVDVNYVGNYLIAGPSTTGNPNIAFSVDKNVDVRAYQSGNFIDSDELPNPGGQPNGSDTSWNMFTLGTVTDQTLTQMDSPFATPAVTTQTASDAYWQILRHVGNHWWLRDDPTTSQSELQAGHDQIDARVIGNVLNFTNAPNGIAANAPNAAELNGVLTAPMISRPAGWDSDNDGMPDTWELAHGLNPNSPGASPDWKLDFDNDGYVNLIEYVNEAGEFPAPAPIVFDGAINNRYAVITNWKTFDGGVTSGSNWQPSRFDEAQINGGTVVVDAAGQHARLLKIGANDDNTATLNITGGWLDVEEGVFIGAHATAQGTLNLSGGTLSTPYLGAGADDTFAFTGGVLHADVIELDLTNNGGTLAPGNSIGQTHVVGDLNLTAGALEIELASPTLADALIVDDHTNLGGNFTVLPLAGYTPAIGDSWPIITSGSFSGQFNSLTSGYSVQQQGNTLMLYFGSAPPIEQPGDENGDGIVGAADYVVLRKAGATPDEFQTWRENFGEGPGSGGSGPVSAPEPATFTMLLFALAPAWKRRRSLRNFGCFLQE